LHEVMVGAGMKVKTPVLVAVPPGFVTVILPVAPFPTVAVMAVELVRVNDADAVPPKATAVVPVKFKPVRLTTVPAFALLGLNEVMVGIVMRVKIPLLLAVPPRVVTLIVPVVPLPIIALSEVRLITVKSCASLPPKATAFTPLKLEPVIVTTVPVGP